MTNDPRIGLKVNFNGSILNIIANEAPYFDSIRTSGCAGFIPCDTPNIDPLYDMGPSTLAGTL
jgi:hypothetical protein